MTTTHCPWDVKQHSHHKSPPLVFSVVPSRFIDVSTNRPCRYYSLTNTLYLPPTNRLPLRLEAGKLCFFFGRPRTLYELVTYLGAVPRGNPQQIFGQFDGHMNLSPTQYPPYFPYPCSLPPVPSLVFSPTRSLKLNPQSLQDELSCIGAFTLLQSSPTSSHLPSRMYYPYRYTIVAGVPYSSLTLENQLLQPYQRTTCCRPECLIRQPPFTGLPSHLQNAVTTVVAHKPFPSLRIG